MTEFQITKPGEYLTRDGKKAVVLCVDAPCDFNPVMGYFIDGPCLFAHSWRLNGEFSAREFSADHGYDIISEWKEPVLPELHESWACIFRTGLSIGYANLELAKQSSREGCLGFARTRLTINPDGTKDIEIIEKVWR